MASSALLCLATVCLLLATITIDVIRAQSFSQCGRHKTSRIVGGRPTIVNEYPMMAGLIQGNSPSVYCGATIVSNWYAVTAAHCLLRLQPSQVRLLVGEHDYNSASDTPYAKLYGLQQFIVYPGYNGGDLYDIALVVTSQPIVYNVAVGPVCLPYGTNQFTGQYVAAVGWGTTSFGGPVSTTLLKAWLQVIGNDQCALTYGNRITWTHMCTLTQGADACQRDSGGPLFIESGGLVYLTGIISFGTTCADNKPNVATRVTAYADWIRRYTG